MNICSQWCNGAEERGDVVPHFRRGGIAFQPIELPVIVCNYFKIVSVSDKITMI